MTNVEKISIALPSEMLETIRDAIDSGAYATTSEVIREALRRWEADRIMENVIKRYGYEELKASLKEADESIDRGEGLTSDQVFGRLTKKYEAMARERKTPIRRAKGR